MSVQAAPDVGNTLGALLIGCILAAAFTGLVTAQIFIYFLLYSSSDKLGYKSLAFIVWFLDLCHTILVGRTVWHELIFHFGVAAKAKTLPWSLAFTIVNTSVLTIIVHCFFIYRIYILSEKNYFISVPLALLALCRLAFACLATSQMISSQTLSIFVQKYKWTFTLDLSISAVMDIAIMVCLVVLLRRQQKKVPKAMNRVLNKLVLYMLQNGFLTCIATILVLVCWLVMPTNLIFMTLYFIIIKLYANSLLGTLNTRKQLHKESSNT